MLKLTLESKKTKWKANSIFVRYFNTKTPLGKERRLQGEKMEGLISSLDLYDLKPKKGKYTWTNKHIGLGHIMARLDHFLLHKSLRQCCFPSLTNISMGRLILSPNYFIHPTH